MNMIDATKICFSKYVTFSGRARRAEYWWFILATMIVSVVLTILDVAILGIDFGFGLADVWSVAVFLPSLAAGARRLHDVNRSGWWLLLGLLPVIGWIILIIWCATPGDRGDNRFGPDPMRGDRASAFT